MDSGCKRLQAKVGGQDNATRSKASHCSVSAIAPTTVDTWSNVESQDPV
jgi:hypothetical protein